MAIGNAQVKHSSSSFPIAILNATLFFRFVKATNNWKRSAIRQILLTNQSSVRSPVLSVQAHKLVLAVYQVGCNLSSSSVKFESVQAECALPWLSPALATLTTALHLTHAIKDKASYRLIDACQ